MLRTTPDTELWWWGEEVVEALLMRLAADSAQLPTLVGGVANEEGTAAN